MPSSTAPAMTTRHVVVILFGLLFPSLVTLVYFVWLSSYSAGVQQVGYGGGKLIQFLFPVVWVVFLQRRRVEWSVPRSDGVPLGVGFGLAVMIAMLLVYHAGLKPTGYLAGASDAVRQKIAGFGVDGVVKYAALGLFYSLAHSFLEEYYWRWFVFGELRRVVSLPTAVTVSSLGFMAHHIIVLGTFFGWLSPATWVFSMSVAIGGAFWAWLYTRYGSLYNPWLSHMLVDAAIFLIGYDMARDMFQ